MLPSSNVVVSRRYLQFVSTETMDELTTVPQVHSNDNHGCNSANNTDGTKLTTDIMNINL